MRLELISFELYNLPITILELDEAMIGADVKLLVFELDEAMFAMFGTNGL
jgi:hypothetical protein